MIEEWKGIPGFEGRYEVSDIGRVRTLARRSLQNRRLQGRILKPYTYNKFGHQQVTLYDPDGARHAMQVHRLVLLAFVGDAPPGFEACHNDGDASNNRRANLRWGTCAENVADAFRHGTRGVGSRSPNAKIDEAAARKIRGSAGTLKSVAAQFGVSPSLVSMIRNRRVWTHA